MKKYRVIRDNYGFMGRYWDKDMVVDLPDDADPPHHFELLEPRKPGKPASIPENSPADSEPKTLSEISESKPVTFQEVNKRKGK